MRMNIVPLDTSLPELKLGVPSGTGDLMQVLSNLETRLKSIEGGRFNPYPIRGRGRRGGQPKCDVMWFHIGGI